MTPESIRLVETTFDEARPSLPGVVATFYLRLLAADPDIAVMFTDDPVRQQEQFLTELEMIVSSIGAHTAFVSEVRGLGLRHAHYGVEATHYRTAGPLLLEALASALGPEWTPAVEHAWQLAYNLTVETMMAGAAGQV